MADIRDARAAHILDDAHRRIRHLGPAVRLAAATAYLRIVEEAESELRERDERSAAE